MYSSLGEVLLVFVIQFLLASSLKPKNLSMSIHGPWLQSMCLSYMHVCYHPDVDGIWDFRVFSLLYDDGVEQLLFYFSLYLLQDYYLYNILTPPNDS